MTEGDCAWVALWTGVAVYDIWAIKNHKETMSQSYLRALESKHRRWPTLMFWGYLISHLTGVIPDKVDPLRRVEFR